MAVKNNPQPATASSTPGHDREEPAGVIRIGSISNEPGKEFEIFQPFADYLAAQLGETGIGHGKVVVARDIDGMATLIAEGEVDSSGETLTLRIKRRDPRTNKAVYSRWVTRRIDQNTRLLEIFLPMPEGQVGPAVTIRSKRRSSKT